MILRGSLGNIVILVWILTALSSDVSKALVWQEEEDSDEYEDQNHAYPVDMDIVIKHYSMHGSKDSKPVDPEDMDVVVKHYSMHGSSVLDDDHHPSPIPKELESGFNLSTWDWNDGHLKQRSPPTSHEKCRPNTVPVRHLRGDNLPDAIAGNEDRFSWGSISDQTVIVVGDGGYQPAVKLNPITGKEEIFCVSTTKVLIYRSDRMIYPPGPDPDVMPRRVKWKQSRTTKHLCHMAFTQDSGHMKFELLYEDQLYKKDTTWMRDCEPDNIPDHIINGPDGEGLMPKYTRRRKGREVANRYIPESYVNWRDPTRESIFGWSKHPPNVRRWKKPPGDHVSAQEQEKRRKHDRRIATENAGSRRFRFSRPFWFILPDDYDHEDQYDILEHLQRLSGIQTWHGKLIWSILAAYLLYRRFFP